MPGRFPGRWPGVTGKPWALRTQVAIDEFFAKLKDSISILVGTPATPTTIQAGVAGNNGAGNSKAVPALDQHVHPVQTAAPTYPTQTSSADGVGTALMRADAKIQQGIVATKGDLLGFAGMAVPVAVGADGYVLTARSSAAAGVDWELPQGASRAFVFFLQGR